MKQGERSLGLVEGVNGAAYPASQSSCCGRDLVMEKSFFSTRKHTELLNDGDNTCVRLSIVPVL